MSTEPDVRRRPSTRTFAAVAVILALVLAGVASYYASSSPDGLERVAEDNGFSDQERTSATGDSPFADYSTEQVDDERLGGALAGVLGVAVVLVLAGGLTLLVRRRSDSGSGAARSGEETARSDRGPSAQAQPADHGPSAQAQPADHDPSDAGVTGG